MYFYEPLYAYQSPNAAIVEQCLPITRGHIEMSATGWISMVVAIEECRVWMTDGQSMIVPPLAPVPQPQSQTKTTPPQSQTKTNTDKIISTAELLRLVAQGRARLINTPVAVAPIAKAAPCSLETCSGRCGMPLHTRSNVMLARAVRTGNILWGDLE